MRNIIGGAKSSQKAIPQPRLKIERNSVFRCLKVVYLLLAAWSARRADADFLSKHKMGESKISPEANYPTAVPIVISLETPSKPLLLLFGYEARIDAEQNAPGRPSTDAPWSDSLDSLAPGPHLVAHRMGLHQLRFCL